MLTNQLVKREDLFYTNIPQFSFNVGYRYSRKISNLSPTLILYMLGHCLKFVQLCMDVTCCAFVCAGPLHIQRNSRHRLVCGHVFVCVRARDFVCGCASCVLVCNSAHISPARAPSYACLRASILLSDRGGNCNLC